MQNDRCWWGCGEIGTWARCRREREMAQLLWNTAQGLLEKLNLQLPCGPAVPLVGIYPKELRAGSRTDSCTPVFIAALVTTPKTTRRWKQRSRPRADARPDEAWRVPCLRTCAATRKEVLTQAATQAGLENMTRSESSRTRRNGYCMVPLTPGTKDRQIHRDWK